MDTSPSVVTGPFVFWLINTSLFNVLRVVDLHTRLISSCNIFDVIYH
jgi:hypothetical protein